MNYAPYYIMPILVPIAVAAATCTTPMQFIFSASVGAAGGTLAMLLLQYYFILKEPQ